VSEGDFAIAWRAPSRRALARLPEKVATVAVEFVYGSLAADPQPGRQAAQARPRRA